MRRGQHEVEPSGLDRLAAEMPQIGVARLPAGHREKHRAQRHQPDRPVREQEMDGVPGIDRGQHRGVVADVNDPHHGKRGEPHDHHRTEGGRNPRRAATLNRKQHDQDEQGHRPHIVLERRRCELETFDGRQHRDRRRDHGIADEHRRADHAEPQQKQASPAERPLAQRHQRQRAALAVVVGAQQKQDIFGGDDDQKRPQDQREHAKHHDARGRLALRCARHGLAKRIKRRGSNIAEDDANASKRQRPEACGDRSVLGFVRCDGDGHEAEGRSMSGTPTAIDTSSKPVNSSEKESEFCPESVREYR